MPATTRQRPRPAEGGGEGARPPSKKGRARGPAPRAADAGPAAPEAGDGTSDPPAIDLEAAIVSLLSTRRSGSNCCPSEVPRRLLGESGPWRPLMPAVRAAAARLEARGRVWVTQGGARVDPATAKGPIRLRLPPAEAQKGADGGGGG